MSNAELIEPTIRLKPKVKATDRYKKYLQIASIFLPKPLTEVEILILDELYQCGGQLTTESRKQIRDSLKKSAEQINNYIGQMRNNRVIVKDEINPQLLIVIPEVEEEGDSFIVNVEMQIHL